MEIIKLNGLSEKQTNEIYILQDKVLAFDKTFDRVWMSNDLNFDKNAPSFYLAYEAEKLIGFLTVFMPDRILPEISAFVDPDFRRKGVFTRLLREAKNVLDNYGVKEILLVVNSDNRDGKDALTHFQNEYLRSEARMVCRKARNFETALTFVPCEKNNSKIWAKLGTGVFQDKHDDENAAKALLENPDRKGYIAYLGKTPVGVFGIYFDKKEDEAFLYGLGISKNHRGKGYGKQTLMFAQSVGLARQSKVVLDVDVVNDTALNLYVKSGFTPLFKMDYYKHKI